MCKSCKQNEILLWQGGGAWAWPRPQSLVGSSSLSLQFPQQS